MGHIRALLHILRMCIGKEKTPVKSRDEDGELLVAYMDCGWPYIIKDASGFHPLVIRFLPSFKQ